MNPSVGVHKLGILEYVDTRALLVTDAVVNINEILIPPERMLMLKRTVWFSSKGCIGKSWYTPSLNPPFNTSPSQVTFGTMLYVCQQPNDGLAPAEQPPNVGFETS